MEKISLKIISEYNKIDKIILNSINNNFGFNEIDFVIITGSFGRYEGTFKKIKKNYKLLNDIDLLIVSSTKNLIAIETIKAQLKKILHIPHIDIECISFRSLKNKLKKNITSISIYDFFNGSRVLYQKKTLPNFLVSHKNIPISEFSRLIINRVVGLLDGLFYKRNKRYLYIYVQISKLLISFGDFILFTKHNFYSSSYSDRYEKFKEISKNSELDRLILLGYEFKLCPKLLNIYEFDYFVSDYQEIIKGLYIKSNFFNLNELAIRDLNSVKDIIYSNFLRLINLSFFDMGFNSNYLIVSKNIDRIFKTKKVNRKDIQKIYNYWMIYCH